MVGAQRSGTTYLYHMLDEHPEVCMAKPVFPEPKYFLSKNAPDQLSFYEEKFYAHADQRTLIFGEKSTSYYESHEVAARLKRAYPESAIVFMLRNPVDRAISNYRYSVMNGLETRSLREVFLKNNPPPGRPSHLSTDPFQYIDRSDYLKFIQKYLQHFNRSKVLILVLENLANNAKAIQEVYRYLEVDDKYIPADLSKIINPIEENDLEDDDEVQRKLYSVFEEKVQALEEYLAMDLSVWKK
ncbi:sulfotransferase [Acidobacteriota bacterium]